MDTKDLSVPTGVRFLLLGPFRVVDDSGEVHDLRGRTGTVLAALVVDDGGLVSSDRLIDILWGEQLPASPDNALHTVISRLRTSLEPLGLDDRIVTEAGGYRLLTSEDEVDSRRFESAVKAVEGPADVAGIQRLRAALDLWRGPALEGLRARHHHLSAEAGRLESLWFTALETTIESDLVAGRHRTLVPELVALTARHPTRETLWAFLMEALYLSGRQAEALAAFRAARTHLATELGLEPSESLAALEGTILRHEPVPSVRAAAPARATGDGIGYLPRRPVHHANRTHELETLGRLVDQHQLVSIAGAVGIGKTALARVWAHDSRRRFAGGIWWLDARVRPGRAESTNSVDDAASRLASLVGDQRAVVVLDNVDGVRSTAARAARSLVERTPSVTVITIACEPFSFAGGAGLRVGALERKEASDFLTSRVEALSAEQGFEPSEDLLDAVDGHPLAIEIAAGAIALDSLAPSDVVAALPHLIHHDPEADPQHRSLMTAVNAALGLLSEVDRSAIQILARFDEPRSFTDCAEAVAGSLDEPESAPAAVASLLATSLVRSEAGGLVIVGPIRAAVRARSGRGAASVESR